MYSTPPLPCPNMTSCSSFAILPSHPSQHGLHQPPPHLLRGLQLRFECIAPAQQLLDAFHDAFLFGKRRYVEKFLMCSKLNFYYQLPLYIFLIAFLEGKFRLMSSDNRVRFYLGKNFNSATLTKILNSLSVSTTIAMPVVPTFVKAHRQIQACILQLISHAPPDLCIFVLLNMGNPLLISFTDKNGTPSYKYSGCHEFHRLI